MRMDSFFKVVPSTAPSSSSSSSSAAAGKSGGKAVSGKLTGGKRKDTDDGKGKGAAAGKKAKK
jgi:hypothetical protein